MNRHAYIKRAAQCLVASAFGFLLESGVGQEVRKTNYPQQSLTSPNGQFRVLLDPQQNLLAVYDANEKLLHKIPPDQLLAGAYTESDTTLPIVRESWFQRATGFFGEKQEIFYLRLTDQKMIGVKLSDGSTLSGRIMDFEDFTKQALEKRALKLLDDKEPRLRETGAVLCGQLKIVAAKKRLNELLKDPSYVALHGKGANDWSIVLFVRQAAEEALVAMGEKPRFVMGQIHERQVAFKTHKVVKGESLSRIAMKYYGRDHLADGMRAILNANPWLRDGMWIYAGKELRIPDLAKSTQK